MIRPQLSRRVARDIGQCYRDLPGTNADPQAYHHAP